MIALEALVAADYRSHCCWWCVQPLPYTRRRCTPLHRRPASRP